MKKLLATIAAAGLVAGAHATEWDLTYAITWVTIWNQEGIVDGDVAFGEQSDIITGPLYIADGATVTLRDVSINKQGKTSTDHAGIECMGDATIILEGSNLVKGYSDSYPGIFVPQGKTLTIKGAGSLAVGPGGKGYGAGIGAGRGKPCGNIVIEGGTIYAQSKIGGGAGIGGAGGDDSWGMVSSCGNITIKGGNVIAIGSQGNVVVDSSGNLDSWWDRGGAGIGCGFQSACGSITIEGGTVTATGYTPAAGLGGSQGSCGTLMISGGTVTAKSNVWGAGIGGGYSGGCGNVSITGGSVSATGGQEAAGIGTGRNGTVSGVTISDGITSVVATPGKNCTTAIGAGKNGTCSSTSIASGIPSATSGNTRILGPTLDLSTLVGDTVVANGMTLTGTLKMKYKISIAAGARVGLSDATIKGVNDSTCGWAGITCLGNAEIYLEGVNTVRGFYQDYPGIYVPSGSTLKIRTLGWGSLKASSNGRSAGIGAGKGAVNSPERAVTVKGGTVLAWGGDDPRQPGGMGGSQSQSDLILSHSPQEGKPTTGRHPPRKHSLISLH